MKKLLKGAIVFAIIMFISLAVHIFCNMKGIQIDTIITAPTSAVCAMLIYHGLTKNDDKQK